METIKVFVCIVEDYDGNKNNCRVFANNAEEARQKLMKEFPDCFVHPAITLKEFKHSQNN